MTNELTDKNYVILLAHGDRIYINCEQAQKAKMVKQSGNDVEIDGNYIANSEIKAIIKAIDIDYSDRIKRGETMCNYGVWHKRGDMCACAWKNRGKRVQGTPSLTIF